MQSNPRSPAGIRKRHSRSCSSRRGNRCDCRPAWEASVYLKREGRKLRKTFPTQAAAKAWRVDALSAQNRGMLRTPLRVTLAEAADEWLRGARSGAIRNRSGDVFKPSAVRAYEAALRLRVLPELGHVRVTELRLYEVQDFANRLLAAGLNASTISCTLLPLRAIYARAISRGEVAVNPTAGVRLPAVRGRRERIASPEEATMLLAALPEEDRALWATALYAGLRRGELQALRWDDVDLAAGVIRVERSWDAKVGPVAPKSHKARRRVPIPAVLRDHLVEHRMRHPEAVLVFGRDAESPFSPSAITKRARAAWADHKPITLHEARHTFASLMIAAGVNAKALSTYMGHASVTITYDRYGHLMPGNEEEAAALLDAYLGREREDVARTAALA